jgi:hypothetical protein
MTAVMAPTSLKAAKLAIEARKAADTVASLELRLVEADRRDREQFQDAIKLGNELIEHDEHIDELLADLRAAFDKRDAMIERLLMSGCVPPAQRLGLGGSDRTDSAFRFARLQDAYKGNRSASSYGDEALAVQDARTVERLAAPVWCRSFEGSSSRGTISNHQDAAYHRQRQPRSSNLLRWCNDRSCRRRTA